MRQSAVHELSGGRAKRGGGPRGVVVVLLAAVGLVVSPAGALIATAPAGADIIIPASVSIGNGPAQVNGSYVNAQNIADELVGTNITIQATSQINIVDPSDLATSLTGTPQFNLTLIAPNCNVREDLNLAAVGNRILDCNTLNLNARITSGGTSIDPNRVVSTATQVNVLGNTASIQQAIDSSSSSSPVTVQVSPGQY